MASYEDDSMNALYSKDKCTLNHHPTAAKR